jgi:hypothetical protein
MRGYKDFTCVKFSESGFTWGGSTFTGLLLDSGDTVPTNVSTTNVISSTSDNSGAGTQSHSFMSPDVFDVVSAIDGTAYGSFRLYVSVASTGTGSANVRITSVDIKIEAIDSDGNSRILVSNNVWTGTHLANFNETKYLGIMYWFSVSKQEIAYNERLKLSIEYDWTRSDPLNQTSMTHGITCSPVDRDMTLSIPFLV